MTPQVFSAYIHFDELLYESVCRCFEWGGYAASIFTVDIFAKTDKKNPCLNSDVRLESDLE